MSIFIVAIVIIVVATMISLAVSSNTNKAVNQTKQNQETLMSREDYKQELKELKQQIKIKQKELENLVYATEQAKRRTIANLTVEQEEALELYEKLGIRIPVDIVEELSYSNYVTYNNAVNFIETQRKIWKSQLSVAVTKGMR